MPIGKVTMRSDDTTQVLDKLLENAETAADSAKIRKAFAFTGRRQMKDLLTLFIFYLIFSILDV